MTTTRKNYKLPMGFPSALTVLFIALKLTHYIDWSWVWVLAPLWLPLGVALFFLYVAIVLQAVMKVVE